MIEIQNLNKYYNKNKTNELHVLDSVSLSLERKGMVALLGKSGSGKTTLLNCISGNDSYDSGECLFDGIKAECKEKFYSFKRKNIGVVFQNSSLIESRTVEENLITGLKIAGIKSARKTIDSALEAVGMSFYNKRLAGTLSGGQKQRVAIARALCISPKIIIADEPTANLDADNSVSIFEILKNISKDTLVIIASHEKKLVEAYADRIIEIDNHRITSDRSNNHIIVQQTETHLPKSIHKRLFAQEIEINLFFHETHNTGMRIDIAVDDNRIFVSSNDGLVSCVDNAYNALQDQPVHSVNRPIGPVEITEYSEPTNKPSFLNDTRNSFSIRRYFSGRLFKTKLQKITALIMALAAVFLSVSLAMVEKVTKIDERAYRESSKKAAAILSESFQSNYLEIKYDEEIDYIAPYGSPMYFSFCNKTLNQSSNNNNLEQGVIPKLDVKPLPLEFLSEDSLLFGRMPQNVNEAVMDAFYLQEPENDDNYFFKSLSYFGITTAKGMIGSEMTLDDVSLTIVGISDTQTPTVYMDKDLITSLAIYGERYFDNLLLSEEWADKVSITEKLGATDVLVSKQVFDANNYDLSIENEITIGSTICNLAGWFETTKITSPETAYLVSPLVIESVKDDMLSSHTYIEVIVKNNVQDYLDSLQNRLIYGINLTQSEYSNYLRMQRSKIILQLVVTVIVGLSSLLCFFFVNKAAIADQMRELAIKVALGIKRISVLEEFVLNSIVTVTICSLPFYVITQLIIKTMQTENIGIFKTLGFSGPSFIIGCLILLIFPIIVCIASLIKIMFMKPVELL